MEKCLNERPFSKFYSLRVRLALSSTCTGSDKILSTRVKSAEGMDCKTKKITKLGSSDFIAHLNLFQKS